MKGIARFAGWRAVLDTPSGRIAKAFSDTVYGGSAAAEKVADRWYRVQCRAFGIPVTKAMIRTKSIKGKRRGLPVGVAYIPENHGRRARYRATICVRGTYRTRDFTVQTYGKDEAEQLARAQRKRWEREIMGSIVRKETTR